MAKLVLEHIKKIYQTEQSASTTALKDISFEVADGQYVAIMGESGSGKSTLLNTIATLDKATSGNIYLNDIDLNNINDRESSKFRRQHLGFIFQKFNLLNIFDCKDNIFLPIILDHKNPDDYQEQFQSLIKQLDIQALMDKFPNQLSGGQMQRIAVARALIMQPDLILADEPTGALDSKTSDKLLDILQRINSQGQTILMVTHSATAASHCQRVLFISDGQIAEELSRNNQTNQQFYEQIIDYQRSN